MYKISLKNSKNKILKIYKDKVPIKLEAFQIADTKRKALKPQKIKMGYHVEIDEYKSV